MSGPRVPKTTADAIRQQAYAARNRAVAQERALSDPIEARWAMLESIDMEKYAEDFLALPSASIEVGVGGELVPIGDDATQRPDFVETVRAAPDLVTARASIARLELVAETGALDLAIDTADTIKARNSLEKMLAHQIAGHTGSR